MPVIFLTTSGTFSPPADWPGRADKIECVGSGGNGAAGTTALSGGGGGGGEYAAESGVLFLNSGTAYTVGTAGGATNTSIVAGGLTITAHFGANATGVTAGSGGTGSANTVHFNGGGGGTGGSAVGRPGAGGGGSGGPLGAGALGGNAAGTSGWKGSGGGGDGSSASPSAGTAGTAAATGGAAGTPDGAAGGNGLAAAGTATAGGTSTASTSFDATHGVSGGGGGGGGNSGGSGTRNGGAGGAGGPAAGFGGGGGGGGSAATAGGALGAGRPGLIAVTYTSANLVPAEASVQVIVYPDVQYNVLAPGRLYYRSAAWDPQIVTAPTLPAAATTAGVGSFGREVDLAPSFVAAASTGAVSATVPGIGETLGATAATGIAAALTAEIDNILGSISAAGSATQLSPQAASGLSGVGGAGTVAGLSPSLGIGFPIVAASGSVVPFGVVAAPGLAAVSATGVLGLFAGGGNQTLTPGVIASAVAALGPTAGIGVGIAAALAGNGLLVVSPGGVLTGVATTAAIAGLVGDPAGLLTAIATASNVTAFSATQLQVFLGVAASGQAPAAFGIGLGSSFAAAVALGAAGNFLTANLVPAEVSVQVIVYPNVQYNVLAPGRLYYRSEARDQPSVVQIVLTPVVATGGVGLFNSSILTSVAASAVGAPLSPLPSANVLLAAAATASAAQPLSIQQTFNLSVSATGTVAPLFNPEGLTAVATAGGEQPFAAAPAAGLVSTSVLAGIQPFGPMLALLGTSTAATASSFSFTISLGTGIAQAAVNTFGPTVALVAISTTGTPRSFSAEIDYPFSPVAALGGSQALSGNVFSALSFVSAAGVTGSLVADPGAVLAGVATLSFANPFSFPALVLVPLGTVSAAGIAASLGATPQQLLIGVSAAGSRAPLFVETDVPLSTVVAISGISPFTALPSVAGALVAVSAIAAEGVFGLGAAFGFANAVATGSALSVTPLLLAPMGPAIAVAGEGQMASLGVLLGESALAAAGMFSFTEQGFLGAASALPGEASFIGEFDILLLATAATGIVRPFFLPGQVFVSGVAAKAAFGALGFELDAFPAFAGAAGVMQAMPLTVSITTPTHTVVATLATSLESGIRIVKITYEPYPPLRW